ncbi:MAG: cupin domain-containing protein [Chitinophagaceae bacterium]|nr:cupin domain-containing protein [Chitinophagaceae bacterium]
MKLQMIAIASIFSLTCFSQQDTVATDVYKWKDARPGKEKPGAIRNLVHGSTLDLADFTIYTITLPRGENKQPAVAYENKEQLIIVKDGTINLTANDKSNVMSGGGLALVLAGDRQHISNTSNQPATYYVISYTGKAPVNMERGKSGGGSFMVDWKDMLVKQTEKGQSRPIFDRPSSMFPHFDVHATTLNPGISSHAAHTHRVEEIILMIRGTGNMQLGNEFKKTTDGDVVFVNSMVPHAITNIGTEPCSYFAIQWHTN